MGATAPIAEETQERHDYDQLLIVEKYEQFIEYIYPIACNIPRQHGVGKAHFIEAILTQPNLFIEAGKTGQINRLYLADAGISNLRYWLRFWSAPQRSVLTHRQHRVASVHLAETGRILGSWIAHKKSGSSGHKMGTL